MSIQRPFTYVLLRYRHDPLAGEFANVGVLVYEPKSGFLDAKVRHTLGRLPKMFPDLDAEAFKRSARSIERSIKRAATRQDGALLASLKDAGTFAKSVLPHDNSSFVWSSVGSGITANPSETLNKLYDRFVARYDEPQRQQRDDEAIWRPVRDRLAERRLVDRLQPKTITSPLDHVDFEHAWKDGEWHCYQPLSFDLANEERIRDKACRWAGRMLALKNATERFRTYFFVGFPSDDRLRSAYDAAVKILKLSPGQPEVFEESRLDDLVNQLEDEMNRHEEYPQLKS